MQMTSEEFFQKLHINLTEQQLSAVKKTSGPSLLLAVPGSGKTTVLVTRLGYMVCCCGIDPGEILTLTYTISASRDMVNRFRNLFQQFSDIERLAELLEFRTINGICMKILLYFGYRTGKKMYDLLDREDERKSILSQIFRSLKNDYATESELQDIGARITFIKNMMLTDAEIEKLASISDVKLIDIYRSYCAELRRRQKIDYDDQMIYAYRILNQYPEILSYFQNKYRYICVDEAQDTSRIQHEIISLLAGKYQNLFMVGDEDQSIYGFRAAYPQALLNFEKDHPGAEVLLMETNFRSDANIVASADTFIQKNLLRHKKTMKASKDSCLPVKVISLSNRKSQFTYLSKAASDLTCQTAILYRDNESAIPLIDLLDRDHIPYNVKNADLSFFSHRTVADICNIIRFAQNPSDTDLFMKIYYKVKLYMNRETAEQVCHLSALHQIPVLTAAIRYGNIPAYGLTNCRTIQTHLRNLAKEKPDQALYTIMSPMGYGEYLERSAVSDRKIYILKTLSYQEPSLDGFLNRLEALRDLISTKDFDPQANLILSTIHGSKGLEYDTVYLMDIVDGIFPEEVPQDLKKISEEERSSWEEERRLFYVGMTRAKNRLFLFDLERNPSVFVKEVKKSLPPISAATDVSKTDKWSEPAPAVSNNRQDLYIPAWGKKRTEKVSAASKHTVTQASHVFPDYDHMDTDQRFLDFCDDLGEGMIVTHRKFGRGVITEMNSTSVRILFDEGSEKKLGLKILFQKNLLSHE